MNKPLTVGRLSEETGVSKKAIRYYEQEKLIPKAGRTVAGYRHYGAEVIERLKFIQKAKAAGFHLEDIRELLSLRFSPNVKCDAVRARAEKTLGEVEKRIAELSAIRKTLKVLIKDCAGRSSERCPILKKFDSSKEAS